MKKLFYFCLFILGVIGTAVFAQDSGLVPGTTPENSLEFFASVFGVDWMNVGKLSAFALLVTTFVAKEFPLLSGGWKSRAVVISICALTSLKMLWPHWDAAFVQAGLSWAIATGTFHMFTKKA